MIIWHDKLYVDSKIKKNQRKIIKKINKGKLTYSVYCISLAINENNLFDIISTSELKWSYYNQKEIVVIGLAYGRESAIELVSIIVGEIYKVTGTLKVREYFG